MARILVVDDSPTVTMMFRRFLAQQGHSVFVAANGVEGIEAARRECPDVVLLDHVLPDMTGFDVCRSLRKEPALASSRIMMLTGSSEPGMEEKSREAGADAFHTKDGGLAKVFEAVNGLLALGVAP